MTTGKRRAISRLAVCIGGVVFCGHAFAVDVYAVYSAASKPDTLADGAVRFSYSGDAIASVTVTPTDGGTIWLAGDTMTNAADAAVMFAAPGTLGISNAVTCAGNLSVTGCGGMTRGWQDGYASTLTTAAEFKAALMPTNFITLFTDMNLDEWEPYAYYDSDPANRTNVNLDATIKLNADIRRDFFLETLERNETDGVKGLTAIMSWHSGGAYTAFTVEMRQNGPDVQGRLVLCERDSSHNHAGKILAEALLDPVQAITARTLLHPDSSGSSGFGITQLTMRRVTPPSVLQLEGKLTVPAANKVVIAEDVRVMGRIGVSTAAAGSTATETSPNFEANGMLTLFDGSEIGGDLRGRFTGTGVVEIAGINSRTNESVRRAGTELPLTPAEASDLTMDFWDSQYIYNNKFAAIASCRQLLDLTNAVAYVVGTYNPSPRSYASLFHLRWKDREVAEGKRLVCQFQGVHSSGLSNICCYVEFMQSTEDPYADLHAYFASAWMVPNDGTYPIGMDFDTLPAGAATQVPTGRGKVSADGIALRDIRLYFKTPRAGYLYAPENVAYANGMSDASVLVVGGSPSRHQHFVAA